MDPKTLAALGQILQMREYMRNQQPFNAAIAQAKQEYPRFKNMPLALTAWPYTGNVGPGTSETFQPGDQGNPSPNNVTVQLRNDRAINDPSTWAPIVALEALHGLQENDPKYQGFVQQFAKSMTPQQTAMSKRMYARDTKEFGPEGTYDQWNTRVNVQEWLRGLLFQKFFKQWTPDEPQWPYTPAQRKLGAQVNQYLKTDK